MKTSLTLLASMSACALFASATASATTTEEAACGKARAEARTECIQFMKTHTWDDSASNWVLKPGVRPPEGVASRDEIKGERDKFIAANHWNDAKGAWEPRSGKPVKEPITCTREEVKADCAAFMKTHRYDDVKGAYVPKNAK